LYATLLADADFSVHVIGILPPKLAEETAGFAAAPCILAIIGASHAVVAFSKCSSHSLKVAALRWEHDYARAGTRSTSSGAVGRISLLRDRLVIGRTHSQG